MLKFTQRDNEDFCPFFYPMKQTNRLIRESSPYLLQHAHNPVDWYPWGPEALERAHREDKPILVSIGYAACHWCHVMERESFEEEATAKLMNEHFINIKVDREERPDIDHLYMDAVQAMTGAGGWPLNVFLTPDGQAFYGGTYFPPVRAYNRASWKETLEAVAAAYQEKRGEVDSQARQLTAYLKQANQQGGKDSASDTLSLGQIKTLFQHIMQQADTSEGGFGHAPKFPGTFSIRFLMRYYAAYGDESALQQALLSLDKMISGGIYDQVGGGFARYSTDRQWLVPHFEKMLYDNALLLEALSEAFQLTQQPQYAQVVRETLSYITREMLSPEGGFFSSQDADSEGEEGKYYTWSRKEIEEVLGAEANLFCEFFDVTDEGNWEGKNILHIKRQSSEFAAQHGIEPALWSARLEAAKKKLLSARSERVPPLLDDKILLNWNALMLSACCKAYAALGEDAYKEMALQNDAFIWQKMKRADAANALWHRYKAGATAFPAFLDDYAFYIRALLDLQEMTANQEYLLRAHALTRTVIEHFSDEQEIFFYFTPEEQTDVIVRKKDIYDGATPSGNAVMAENLDRLGVLLGQPAYRERALKMRHSVLSGVIRYPTSFGVWAWGCLDELGGLAEIAIVGQQAGQRLKELLAAYLPGKVMMAASEPDKRFPLLEGKETGEDTLIYLCRDYHCEAPVGETRELLKSLRQWND